MRPAHIEHVICDVHVRLAGEDILQYRHLYLLIHLILRLVDVFHLGNQIVYWLGFLDKRKAIQTLINIFDAHGFLDNKFAFYWHLKLGCSELGLV